MTLREVRDKSGPAGQSTTPPGLTLANLTEKALAVAVDELEQQRGEPFPPRDGALKTGRQIE